MMEDIRTALRQTCRNPVVELPRRASNELHFVIEEGDDLVRLCQWVEQQGYYLCTMVANDERFLEDHVFKLYYVFSAPKGALIILENPLKDPLQPTQYASIRQSFPWIEPLEREVLDLFGLAPRDGLPGGALLHTVYPDDLYPLRPRRPLDRLKAALAGHKPSASPAAPPMPAGVMTQVVGPIHAGVIEAGQFCFEVGGEVIEHLTVRLGYKHRGIEKLFETNYTLETGWKLAERVSGDSSFSHALAYCQAVEALAGVQPPLAAHYWRAILLELERVYNHVGDVAALINDIGLDLIASAIAIFRERAVRLNRDITGHRLLRGVNRPGGVVFERPWNLDRLRSEVRELADQFLDLSNAVLRKQSCRDRLMGIGVLTKEEARSAGATGLMARASAEQDHDFRLKHPQGAYLLRADLREAIRATVTHDDQQPSATGRRVPIFQRDLQGDVFARLVLRIAEIETSVQIIERLTEAIGDIDPQLPSVVAPEIMSAALRQTHNFEFGLGYVEGWRGDIFYWVMKGPGNTIRRCKVRDPSAFNWHAFRLVVVPHTGSGGRRQQENILADFPIINKSCNLSYAGYDL